MTYPQTLAPLTYTNQFGSVRLTPVTEFLPIRSINKNMPEAIAQGITTDDAEKVALVTENRHIQVCFHWPMNGKAYVVLHNSPSAAAICQVEVL